MMAEGLQDGDYLSRFLSTCCMISLWFDESLSSLLARYGCLPSWQYDFDPDDLMNVSIVDESFLFLFQWLMNWLWTTADVCGVKTRRHPVFASPPSLLCYVTRIYNTQQATPFLRMNNEMNGVLSTTTMRFQWRRRRSDSIDFQQRRELRTPLTNASMSNASFLMTAPHYTSPERWMLLLLLVKSSPAWMFDPWYYYYDDCEYVQPFCLYSMIRSIYYVTVLTRQEDDDPTYTHSTLPRESLLQPILLHASQN